MNRIEKRFKDLKERGETAFIPFITAGDPTLEFTARLVPELEKAGADIIEFGVPFSDPMADGVVNQEAAQRALKHNVSLHDIVRTVGELRAKTQVPIVLFTYFNPIMAYGFEALAADCARAGVDGILCVDLPPEEAGDYNRIMSANNICTIYLIAPTSTDDRVELIAKQSTGFVYYVSRTGVTGVQSEMQASVRPMVEKIQRHKGVPVAVGFGISTPEHAAAVAEYADGVIVGSAIVRKIGELGDTPNALPQIVAFVKSLAEATKRRKAGAVSG
ncbi:MAG: tryptophan synthase subunit alpha [FCB group bacterium]|nr:tryptophan synthase subunit alpha [FCB group bacterium]